MAFFECDLAWTVVADFGVPAKNRIGKSQRWSSPRGASTVPRGTSRAMMRDDNITLADLWEHILATHQTPCPQQRRRGLAGQRLAKSSPASMKKLACPPPRNGARYFVATGIAAPRPAVPTGREHLQTIFGWKFIMWFCTAVRAKPLVATSSRCVRVM